MKKNMETPLRLTSLNHISLVCRSLEKSIDFYTNVLGFVPVRRPNSFNFDGAWLFSYGIGIHLLQSEDPEHMMKKSKIDPKDNHISFQILSSFSLINCNMFLLFSICLYVICHFLELTWDDDNNQNLNSYGRNPT
ncbi:hypothetical protein LOK49_LG14G01109 [Camellia lanceoleosa]|uniref:Uncharacterized protein n=1 Tax=Camellia lanceoleosa TaxID=1840588 RepID=A0ACC0FFW5_9ERIC|nr:hypothetical protein LOK49_LG14G01109 [Camellia lanceoleosa]